MNPFEAEYGFQRYISHRSVDSGALPAADSTVVLATVPADEYWLLFAVSAVLSVGAVVAQQATITSSLGVGVVIGERITLSTIHRAIFTDGAGMLLVPRSVLNGIVLTPVLNDQVVFNWIALQYKRLVL